MRTIFKTSFEGGFEDYQGIGELTVPKGWTPDWLSLEEHEPGKLHRPEYDQKDKFAGQPEVHSGRFAANFFTVFSTHDACLYRTLEVGVNKGDAVRVTVMAMSVAHDKDNPHNHGTHGLRVGIDPAGGTKFDGLNVRYSDWYASHDPEYQERKWVKLTAEAIAEADTITVFLHSRAEFAIQISASHWDDVVVEVLEAGDLQAEASKPEAERFAPPKLEHIRIESLTLEQLEDYIQLRIEQAKNK